jgi:hypothetical protein
VGNVGGYNDLVFVLDISPFSACIAKFVLMVMKMYVRLEILDQLKQCEIL